MLARAEAAGELSGEVPLSMLPEMVVGCVAGALQSRPELGPDDTVAAIADLLLRGLTPAV
jgi:hypothetical protein